MQIFRNQSIFNRRITKDPVLDKDSDLVCEHILHDVLDPKKKVVLGRGQSSGVPIYFVDSSTKRVPVATLNGTQSWKALLAKKFKAGVPIPTGALAQVENGDRNLCVIDLETKELWEMWQTSYSPTAGWSFNWGGYKDHVDAQSARYERVVDDTGTVLQLPNWGVSASGISVVGGVVLHDEIKAGYIPHALQMTVPYARHGVHAYPAQRQDGSDMNQSAAPEGAHLQVDPKLDFSSLAFPINIMAKAAQEYGIVVMDGTGGRGTSFRIQTASSAGYDALAGVPDFLGNLFPWKHLRLLPMNLQTEIDNTKFRYDTNSNGYVKV